jgi:outer membrane protein
MTKTILIAAALTAIAPAALAQNAKLGHIDRQALMLTLPERKDAEARMQAFAQDLDKRLKAMGAEYTAKRDEAEQKAATMTNTEKEVALRELADMEKRITDAQSKAEDDLAKQEEELLAPMVKRTNDAIKAVAEEHNFTYIFDSSTGMVLYYDKGEDILPLVKAKLGIQ